SAGSLPARGYGNISNRRQDACAPRSHTTETRDEEKSEFMKRVSSGFLCLLMVCLLALAGYRTPVSSAAATTNWPQWRGPDSQGISNEKNLPTEWSET